LSKDAICTTLSGGGFRLNLYYLRQYGIEQWHALRRNGDMGVIVGDEAKLRYFAHGIHMQQVGSGDTRPLR
jgi:hypothetical protein